MSVEIFSRLEGEYVPPTALPEGYTCRQLRFPDTPFWRATVYELVSRLGFVENWQETEGRIEPHQAANIGAKMFDDFFRSRCEVIGEIKQHTLQTLPANWLPCDGNVYQKSDYPELYAAIHPTFRLNAQTFRVPDLRQKFIYNTVAGQPYSITNSGGAETVTLTEAQMPAHVHAPPITGDEFATYNAGFTAFKPAASPPGPYGIRPGGGVSTTSKGGGQAHNNMPPYYVLYAAIVAR